MNEFLEVILLGLALGWASIIFKRKNGIGGVFLFVRRLPVLRLAFKCEPCTIFWVSTAGYWIAATLTDIDYSVLFWLATVALAQLYVALVNFAVQEDPEPKP